MANMAFECPNCGVKSGFESRGQYANDRNYVVLMECLTCRQGVIAYFVKALNKGTPHEYNGDPSKSIPLMVIVPVPPQSRCPAHVPENIKRFFEQAEAGFRGRHWDACGAMCRKTVDVATMLLDKSLADKRLVDRIDALNARGAITADLREWAHAIRLDGNEATHEPEPFEEATAAALFNFTELFLIYVFQMPGMLKERRDKRTAGAG